MMNLAMKAGMNQMKDQTQNLIESEMQVKNPDKKEQNIQNEENGPKENIEIKEAPKPARSLIQSLASTKNYVASYDDIINNPSNIGFTKVDELTWEFTMPDQDVNISVIVSSNEYNVTLSA